MSVQDRIAKLEGLLARVRRNAAAPRGATAELIEDEVVSSAPMIAGEQVFKEEPRAVEPLDLETTPAPASSRRPRMPATMDEALAGAAAHMERPITRPPESGAEPATEAHIPQAPLRPTTEQLGQTVHLEEGPHADFELDEPLSDTGASASPLSEPSSLEQDLPSGAGTFDAGLAPPPEASAELERFPRRAPGSERGAEEPERVSRPEVQANVVDFEGAPRSSAPRSLLELVDASLSLSGE